MAGARPLTPHEERKLVVALRKGNPRDRALLLTGLFSGFRISEVLSLTAGQIFRNGRVVERVGVRPAYLKGGYGATRWVPISPEWRRGLEVYFESRAFQPQDPLFPSPQGAAGGALIAIGRSAAEKRIRCLLEAVCKDDRSRLSTHSLRKTWARRLYETSGHDLHLVMAGLGHSSVLVTQRYLETDRGELDRCILAGDWTRAPRTPRVRAVPTRPRPERVSSVGVQEPCLPGFENFAA